MFFQRKARALLSVCGISSVLDINAILRYL